MDPGDTICAVATPPGAAARGALRVSGPRALEVAAGVLADRATVPRARAAFDAEVEVGGFRVECFVLVMPGPGSFTGEDVVELHLPGAPLLLEQVAAGLRAAGARQAMPGEFTRRAFRSGRMDLTEAEAVLDLIHAETDEERRRAAFALRGGLSALVDDARAAVQDALALLEAGLDFEEDETGSVEAGEWIPGLLRARAGLTEAIAAVPRVRPGGDLVLLGAANAGKSSLCNVLAGREVALVDGGAGTTRDVIEVELAGGVRLLDTPGDLDAAGEPEAAALRHRDALVAGSAAALLVVDATAPRPARTDLPIAAVVVTKVDLAPPPPDLPPGPRFAVSSRTGDGVDVLRAWLRERGPGPMRADRHRLALILERALPALDRALTAAAAAAPGELVAADLREVLGVLDEVHGRSSPEDILDRVFGRFCLGK